MKKSLLIVTLLVLLCPLPTKAFNLMVTEIADRRTTGTHFKGLTITFNALGDDIADAKATKLTIDEAIDDTGLSLIKDESSRDDFKFSGDSFSNLEVSLKNPKRKATMIKSLVGTFTVFSPQNDPDSVALIPGFQGKADKNLQHKALKKANVTIRILSRETYEEWKTKEEAELKEKALAEGIMGAMLDSMLSLFGGFMSVDDRSVVMLVDDPDNRIIRLEFLDKDDKKINSNSSMSSGNNKIFGFQQKLPDDAKLMVYLATGKSLKVLPIKMTDIVLP